MRWLRWVFLLVCGLLLLGFWLVFGPLLAAVAALVSWLVRPVRDRLLRTFPFLRSPGRAAIAVFLATFVPWTVLVVSPLSSNQPSRAPVATQVAAGSISSVTAPPTTTALPNPTPTSRATATPKPSPTAAPSPQITTVQATPQ